MYLITGGGSGIGRDLAQALAAKNKEVLIVGRREQALAETANSSALINILCTDVSTEEGRKEVVNYLKEMDSLKGLIHNAGIIEPIVPLASISESSWSQIVATNLNAPLFLTQSLFDKLQQGRVLHIGSGVAYFPLVGWSGYCVSKAALSMLTRCWQLEYPHFSLASVMPGIIDTDMQKLVREAEFMEKEKLNFFKKLYQQEHLLSPSTVAEFLAWLLLEVDAEMYSSMEWDIYDKKHHQYWLKAPHKVPDWE